MNEISLASPAPDCDVVVVGAGFAGIYALYQARQRGYTVKGIERGSDVGGTWYWNCLSLARAATSRASTIAYSFDRASIEADWDWS
jgi:cation diffusion facilitator CzcD-associated flavoprotein CzcO